MTSSAAINIQFILCQNLPFLGYIHCNFCLNPRIIHGDIKENVSGCFFSEHSVHCHLRNATLETGVQWSVRYRGAIGSVGIGRVAHWACTWLSLMEHRANESRCTKVATYSPRANTCLFYLLKVAGSFMGISVKFIPLGIWNSSAGEPQPEHKAIY